jgi:hypothetical protein
MNNYSCLLDAASALLNVDVEILAAEVGHDGSEILWPELPEPRNHRGFHIQEIIELFLLRGFGLCRIEARPSIGSLGSYEVISLKLGDINQYMEDFPGIAIGYNLKGNMHAVALQAGDPHTLTKVEMFYAMI